MQSKPPALQLNNVTQVDMGYVDIDGVVQGLSFNPYITVEGPIDPDEQVIQDFGTIKKRIKEVIDDQVSGYDHKLIYDPLECKVDPLYTGSLVSVKTKNGTMIAGSHLGFRPMKDISIRTTGMHIYELMARELEGYLNRNIRPFRFTVNADTRITPMPANQLTPYGHAVTHGIGFSYTHGLPRSTSWGCQFIAHGHSSFIQLLAPALPDAPHRHYTMDYLDYEADLELLHTITEALSEAYFVRKEDYQKVKGSHYVRYTSRSRGIFEYHMPEDTKKIIVLEKDTTIENIAEYIWTRWEDRFLNNNVSGIFVSEGLSKGALAGVRI